jgi:hypothetical protein
MKNRVDLDVLDTQEEAATSAPWFVVVMHGDHPVRQTVVGGAHQDEVALCCDPRKNTKADAEFIASLRNAAPELFVELRALREVEKAARAQLPLERKHGKDCAVPQCGGEPGNQCDCMKAEEDALRAALKKVPT